MEKLYTARATAVGGRAGHAQTDDGNVSVNLGTPGAGKPGTTNPEQLFACGYAACFGGAVEFAARQQGVALTAPVQVDSEVSLLKRPQGGFTIGVALAVTVSGPDAATAAALVREAHETICPYSNAIRGNIEVAFTVHTA